MDGPGVQMRLLVSSSPLVTALSHLFDSLWDRAIPVHEALNQRAASRQGHIPMHELDRQILALMAAGVKDAGIARQLGIGLRTVRRRIGMLMEQLDAETRYQAGLQAARRGWM